MFIESLANCEKSHWDKGIRHFKLGMIMSLNVPFLWMDLCVNLNEECDTLKSGFMRVQENVNRTGGVTINLRNVLP